MVRAELSGDQEGHAWRFGWKPVGIDKPLPLGTPVKPDERLSWPKTIGVGAQHVVAMFGATFVFPLIMGLDPNLAIMMSGVCTILFLLVVAGQDAVLPGHLGVVRRRGGGDPRGRRQLGVVTGAILVAGLTLALVGVHRALRRRAGAAQGAAAGGQRRGGDADRVQPGAGRRRGLLAAGSRASRFTVMVFTIVAAVAFRGFWSRIAIFLALIFGFVLSWVLDKIARRDHRADRRRRGHHALPGRPERGAGRRLVRPPDPARTGVPAQLHPAGAARGDRADRREHRPRRAVAEMTGTDLDPYMGRALFADGFGTALSSSIGGSPTTTYAENIGVMAATRVYSTAAYYVAAIVAILLGLVPKFGAVVSATPGGVLGGITVVLYGMIGLLGAKIWIENKVDFANPVNLVPIAAGIIIGIGECGDVLRRRLRAVRHRPGIDRGDRRLPPGPGGRAKGAARTPGVTVSPARTTDPGTTLIISAIPRRKCRLPRRDDQLVAARAPGPPVASARSLRYEGVLPTTTSIRPSSVSGSAPDRSPW